MRESGIYVISVTVDGKRRGFYLGSSVHLERRWRQHTSSLSLGKHNNVRLQRAYNKYGADALSWEVICLLPPDQILDAETRLLGRLFGHPECYNRSRDARSGGVGLELSDETRDKMRRAQLGKKHSPEQIEKRSAKNRLTRRTPEWKEHMSRVMRGRVFTPEHREKLRQAKLGKPQSADVVERRVSKLRGRERPVSVREKISRARKGQLRPQPSDATRAKMSESQRLRWAKRREVADG